jgi:hypothetical protein
MTNHVVPQWNLITSSTIYKNFVKLAIVTFSRKNAPIYNVCESLVYIIQHNMDHSSTLKMFQKMQFYFIFKR